MTPSRALLAALVALGVVAACHAQEVHIFGGYAYDPSRDCLQASGGVDVIAGPEPTDAACQSLEATEKKSPKCWVAPSTVAFVVDHGCDAPPDYQDQTSAITGACVKALTAYRRKGHSACPAPTDGGGGGLP